MAKAELDKILDKMSGRVTGASQFYVTQRYGRTVISNYPLHRDPKKVTEGQRANNDAFGQTVTICKEEMNNPERLAYWQEQYEVYKKVAKKSLARANSQFFGVDPNATPPAKQKYYKTLRGFIIGKVRKGE